MKFEKSCASLCTAEIRSISTCFSQESLRGTGLFPKEHVEGNETEVQTALREVREETGLEVRLQSGFRQMVEYFPKPNVKKQVVYFLGEAKSSRVKKQEEEISRIIWTDIRRAWRIVAFENDKNLIWMAHKRLQ